MYLWQVLSCFVYIQKVFWFAEIGIGCLLSDSLKSDGILETDCLCGRRMLGCIALLARGDGRSSDESCSAQIKKPSRTPSRRRRRRRRRSLLLFCRVFNRPVCAARDEYTSNNIFTLLCPSLIPSWTLLPNLFPIACEITHVTFDFRPVPPTHTLVNQWRDPAPLRHGWTHHGIVHNHKKQNRRETGGAIAKSITSPSIV